MKKLGQIIVFTLLATILSTGFQKAKAQNTQQINVALQKTYEYSLTAENQVVLIQAQLLNVMQQGFLTNQDRNVLNNHLNRFERTTIKLSFWANRTGESGVITEVGRFVDLGAEFRDLIRDGMQSTSASPNNLPAPNSLNTSLATGDALILSAGGIRREVQIARPNN